MTRNRFGSETSFGYYYDSSSTGVHWCWFALFGVYGSVGANHLGCLAKYDVHVAAKGGHRCRRGLSHGRSRLASSL